jgi:hypothetical protein
MEYQYKIPLCLSNRTISLIPLFFSKRKFTHTTGHHNFKGPPPNLVHDHHHNTDSLAFPTLSPTPSLRPKINAILEFKFCPTKNASLTN